MSKIAGSFLVLFMMAGYGVPTNQSQKVFVENKDGQIVIEAVHYHAKVDKDPHKWVLVKEPPGFAGDGALEAKPTDGTNNNEDFEEKSPRLDYKVKFAKAGKYRVWVRGYGRTEETNSCHVGLDGKGGVGADRIGDFPTEEWVWYNETHDNTSATIEIKEAGTRTLNVWMRENGFIIDKILLTRDESYKPTEKGPAESRE